MIKKGSLTEKGKRIDARARALVREASSQAERRDVIAGQCCPARTLMNGFFVLNFEGN